jgi:hypothetical protein
MGHLVGDVDQLRHDDGVGGVVGRQVLVVQLHPQPAAVGAPVAQADAPGTPTDAGIGTGTPPEATAATSAGSLSAGP